MASFWALEEIVSNVLQWLPPASLLSARLVCRRWNKIVLSQPSNISKPCCYLFTEVAPSRLFDPSVGSWVTVSAPTPSTPNACGRLIPSGGNHGLVAFEELDGSYEEPPPPCFWVGNPMTNRWKLIPGVEELLYDHIRHPGYEFIVVSEGPPVQFKIVAFGYKGVGPGNITLVYDSRKEEWRHGAPFPDEFLPLLSAPRQGRRIVFVSHPWYRHSSVIQVVSYSLEDDQFEVLVEGFRVDQSINTHCAAFLKDTALPLIGAVDSTRSGRVYFYEFRRSESGWALQETSQLEVLQAGVSLGRDGGPLPAGADAEHLYVHFTSNSLAMYVAGKDEFMVLPQPFDSSLKLGAFCTFYPRFDIQP